MLLGCTRDSRHVKQKTMARRYVDTDRGCTEEQLGEFVVAKEAASVLTDTKHK
jgi:hypothetical protein